MLTVGSLCAGACDGMALGLEWAGIGPVQWQVEIDENRRRNLARHWPDADRSVHDIHGAGAANLATVDLVTATFPCKDLSSAGSRLGLDGAQSGLWFECLRVITELAPRWVVVENVASGAKNWVPHVRAGLEGLGYACLPVPIAASDCGAPHRRARVFVVAYLDHGQQPSLAVHAEVAGSPPPAPYAYSRELRVNEQRYERRVHELPHRGDGVARDDGEEGQAQRGPGGEGAPADAHRELGDEGHGDARSERAGRTELAGGDRDGHAGADTDEVGGDAGEPADLRAGEPDAHGDGAEPFADALRAGREGPGSRAYERWRRSPEEGWRAPVPRVLRVVHGLSNRLDRGGDRAESPAKSPEGATPPRGKAASPRKRIEWLGDSVVPHQAEVVGYVIRELEHAIQIARRSAR